MTYRRERPYSRRLFQAALRYFIIGRTAQAAAMFAFTLLSVRLLSPADYGAYMVLLGVVEICRPLSALGLLPTLQQFLPELAMHATRQQLKGFVKWMTVLRFGMLFIFALLLLIFWSPLTTWLGLEQQQSENAAIACALVVTVLGAGFTDHMLEALLEQRFAQTIRALYPLLRLLGMLAAVTFSELTLLVMLWIDLCVSLLCLVLAEAILLRKLDALQPDGSRHFNWKSIAAFAWHLSGAQLLNAIATPGALRVIISRMFGIELAGQFAFIQQLLLQFERFLPSMLLANLVRPVLIARNVQGDASGVATAGGLLWKSNVLLVWPLVGFMFLVGDVVASKLSGSDLSALGQTMAFLSLATASAAQGKIVTLIMQVYHYSALVRSISFLAVLSPLLVWAGSSFGIEGAALGLAFAAWVRSSVALIVLKRQPRSIDLDLSGGIRILFLVVTATLAGLLVRHGIGLSACVAAFTVVLLAALPIFRPLRQSELSLLVSVIGSRAKHLRYLAK